MRAYGLDFPAGTSALDAELYCYRHDTRAEGEGGRLTRWEHFRNAADLLWNYEGSSRRVVWNEWTNRMLQAMIRNKMVGLAGAGSSGKSDAAAVFAIVDYLSAPTETMFLVCSSTISGAKGRIWKSITELWNEVEAKWEREGSAPVGRSVPSKNRIIGLDINGKWSEAVGIWLIAAGKDDENEADRKLKGLKAPTGGVLRLIADEFSDLGLCVFNAMVGNLSSTPGFKGIGMANPGSKLTPFARFVEPVAGWNSLYAGMGEWPTKYGVCLSFDAYSSPRALTPELEVEESDGTLRHQLYNWMPDRKYIEQAKTAFGEDSVEFWAQIRGMFCPTGMERTVWSEIELLNAGKPVESTEWDAPPQNFVAALDPAFVTDGDRSPIVWGECGRVKGTKVLNILGFRIVAEAAGNTVNEEGEDVPLSVSENVINQFRDHCRQYQIPPKHAGFDGTGGGVAFGQWLHTKWSHAVHAIRFNEKPAERRADSLNEHTVYRNRVTQLWVQPKALVRQGQIRGIPLEITEELCMRRWAPNHSASSSCVESKRDMKKRIGKSPDLGDTFCILVEVCILNGLLDIEEIRKDDKRQMKQWRELVKSGLGQNQSGSKSLIAMPSTKRLKFSRRR